MWPGGGPDNRAGRRCCPGSPDRLSVRDVRRPIVCRVRRVAARTAGFQRLQRHARLPEHSRAAVRPGAVPLHPGRAPDNRRQPRPEPGPAPRVRHAGRRREGWNGGHVRLARDAMAHVRTVRQPLPRARPLLRGTARSHPGTHRPRRQRQDGHRPHRSAFRRVQRRGLWARRARQVQEHRRARHVPPLR